MSIPKNILLKLNNLEDVDNYVEELNQKVKFMARTTNAYALAEMGVFISLICMDKQRFLDNYIKSQLERYGAN
jgi:hypothetical protein